MPCCAFAACIVAQLIFVVRALKRRVLGGDDAMAASNPAVEWRLDSSVSAALQPPALRGWLRGRSLRAIMIVGALEIAIVVGAIYGVVEHVSHGGHVGHATGHHVHEASSSQEVIP